MMANSIARPISETSPAFDVMIFAAGQGIRLGHLGSAVPKALLPVWRDGETLEPILLRLFRQIAIARPGVIRLVVHHGSDLIAKLVARSAALGSLTIELVHQEVLDGEAGGLFLVPESDRPTLAIDVDNYLEDDYFFQRLVEAYFEDDCVASIGVQSVPDITRYANVRVSEDGWLLDIVEKPAIDAAFGDLAKMGCYVIGPALFRRGKSFFQDSKGDLATTAAFSNASTRGERIKCIRHRGYYIDIGTLDGYASHLTRWGL